MKANFHNCFAFFLICLPLASSATMPSSDGCNKEFDLKKCVIRIYCYNRIVCSDYLMYYNLQYMYNRRSDSKFEDFVSNCNDGNEFTKFAVVYKYDNIYEKEISTNGVPLIDNNINLEPIYALDLSNQKYRISPNLAAMGRLHYLDLSHNFITKTKLANKFELISLEEINYSYNYITDFDITGEYKFDNLTTLLVSHNNISVLTDGVFEGFSKLDNLDLSYNCIEILKIETFEGIKGLSYLNLSHNKIVDINTSMFRFKNLKHLNLTFNKIQTVSTKSFINLLSLEMLDLSYNSIIRIEETSFSGMPLLKFINFTHNVLDLVNKDLFQNNSHLSDVNFSCNNIRSIPKEIFQDKTLMSFSIEENQLSGPLVKGTFSGLSLVTHLNLDNHLLTSIKDFAFFGLEKLKWLLLSNNKIDLLTKTSFRLMFNLIHLDLSNNKISDLSFEKDDLVSLKHLLLENNYLFHIKHEDFVHLTLNFLNIAQNNISHLEPKVFESLQDLSYFEISNNPLSGSVEEGIFNGLNSLPKLDISYNKLNTISNNSFNGMFQLKDFNASHGCIEIIEFNTFMNTENIKSMDLSCNRLSTFLLNSDHLSHLSTLILKNNVLTEIIDTTFKGLYNLEKVALSNNIIERITNDVFKDQIDLRNLDLSNNNAMRFNVSIVKHNKILNTLLLSGLEEVMFSDEVKIPIKLLQMAEDGIKNISALNLKTLFQLENVILKYNNVSTLSIGDFSGIKTLRSLDLSCNKITEVQPSVFEHNSLLTFLNLSHNMLIDLNYGMFEGLGNLRILDLSFNNINDIKSERFYELQNLYELIVDHNNIDSIDIYEFNALGILSIGENPLPCDILIKLNKIGTPFEFTAIKKVKHQENFQGIKCNVNKKSVINSFSSNRENTNINENDRVLIEIRNELVKIANEKKSETVKTAVVLDSNPKTNYGSPDIFLNKYIEQLITQLTNLTTVIAKETNVTNSILQRILEKVNDYRITSTIIPFTKENATIDNILPYINKIKQEFEGFMASEKQDIMEHINSKLSSMKAQIENAKVSTVEPTQKSSQRIDDSGKSGSVFTEICVALILVILVCYILYKLYKSKLFIRPRRSSSTRELEIPNL